MNARNRELVGLIPATLLVMAGFTAVFIQNEESLSDISLLIGGLFLGLCLATHIVLRFTLPNADPYLFPLFAVLASFGIVVLYRLDESLAFDQAKWYVLGLALFAVTIIALRKDYRVLERYRYLIVFTAIGLLILPRLPVIGGQVNGAYLAINLGPVSFQPAEFAKIAIVIFLASYLRDTRELLVSGARRILFVTLPPLKHFGPLIVVWALAMLMLVFIKDLGSSLMFYGAFLALLYAATLRLSFVVIGFGLFAAGAFVFANTLGHVQARVNIWLDPFEVKPDGYKVEENEGYQIVQALFAQADGGLLGRGFGQAIITPPGVNQPLLPFAETDMIYAIIVNEAGLVGAVAVVLIYLLIAERGFKIATLAQDSFSKLLATGLTVVLALQVFVIIGGVTRVIPLTGVTLPMVSAGGSSIIANFVLLALLLLISDRARRPDPV